MSIIKPKNSNLFQTPNRRYENMDSAEFVSNMIEKDQKEY